jgi:translation initiation factor 2A
MSTSTAAVTMATSPSSETITPLTPSSPLYLYLNSKQGVNVYNIQHNDNNPNAVKEQQITLSTNSQTSQPNEGVIFSPNGQYMAIIYKDRISVHDTTQDGKQVKCISGEEGASISNVQFSPMNTFLVTLGKYSPHKTTSGNLVVWKLFPEAEDGVYDALSCKILLRTKYKASGSESVWPVVQWNDNESICAIWQQEEKSLNFYKYGVPKKKEPQQTQQQTQQKEEEEEDIPAQINENEKQFQLVTRFKKPKVLKFKLSSKSTFAIHTFNAQTQQNLVQIYKYPTFKKPTCFISFVAERKDVEVDVEMKWNKIGSALLVHTTASTDTENENYYGKSQVYFLRANGHFTCQVTLSKSGPVHDVAWSPKGSEFVMVYGFTPAKATLFNESTQVIFEFGTNTRNKCSWSPNGRYLCLAGFGSLTGRMEFWDREKKKMIGQADAKEASVYGWSRDSRLFITATVTPTLRVSNKIQLWKYNGMLLHEQGFDGLYSAVWNHYTPITAAKSENDETDDGEETEKKSAQPQIKEKDRPPSPRALNEGKLLQQTQVVTQKKAYVPPSLRGSIGSSDDSVYKREGHEAPSKPLTKKQNSTTATINQNAQMAKAVQLQRMIPGLPTSAAMKQVTGSGSPQNQQGSSAGGDAAKKKRKRKKKNKKAGDSTPETDSANGDQD